MLQRFHCACKPRCARRIGCVHRSGVNRVFAAPVKLGSSCYASVLSWCAGVQARHRRRLCFVEATPSRVLVNAQLSHLGTSLIIVKKNSCCALHSRYGPWVDVPLQDFTHGVPAKELDLNEKRGASDCMVCLRHLVSSTRSSVATLTSSTKWVDYWCCALHPTFALWRNTGNPVTASFVHLEEGAVSSCRLQLSLSVCACLLLSDTPWQ